MNGGEWVAVNFENAYRNWIQDRMHAGNYGILFDILYDTEFKWDPNIPRDSDRAANGRYLRLRFADESGIEATDEVMAKPCSFLEFAVALAYAIDDKIMYDAENPEQAADWLWEMFGNIELDRFTDEYLKAGGMTAYMYVVSITDRVMSRRYEYNGYLGMFPLAKPEMDQRKVEIWYQANAYFIERYFD